MKAWVKTSLFSLFKTIYPLSIKWRFLSDSGGGNWGTSALRKRHRGLVDILLCVSTHPKHTNARWVGSELRSHAMPGGERISEAVTYTSWSHLCKHHCLQTQLSQRRNSTLQSPSALDTSPRLTNEGQTFTLPAQCAHIRHFLHFFFKLSIRLYDMKDQCSFCKRLKTQQYNTFSVIMWVKRECAPEVP